eukprot:s958_g5.t3
MVAPTILNGPCMRRRRRTERGRPKGIGCRVAAATLALSSAYGARSVLSFTGVQAADFPVSRGRPAKLAEVQLARRPPFQPLCNAKVRCWDLAMVAIAARIARLAATQEAQETKEDEELPEDEAELEAVEEDEEVSMPVLELDPERAKGIAKVVKEAKKQQLRALDMLREQQLITDEASTLQALRALRLAGLHEEVFTLFAEVNSLTILPEACAEQMASLEAAGSISELFQQMDEMRRREIRPNISCYNRLMRLHARNRSTTAALTLLAEMRENSVKPDVHTYDFALGSCNSRKKWENIITLLDSMQEDGVKPNSSCYRTIMHGLSYSEEHYERCYDLYIEMRENGITPEEHHLVELTRALFGAEGQERDETKGLDIFQTLVEDSSVKFTEVHFDMAISICEKAGKWREILALATAMGGRGITPHSMTCNAVLKACVQLGKWDVALKLLGTMERDGTQLDRIAYLTVLAACAGARQWDEVLKLYADIEDRFPEFIGPDMMLPTIAAMCEVGREEEAIALYRKSFGSLLARQQSRRRGNDPIVLDARRLSPQVAGIMMRCALEDSAKSADATAARAAKPMALAGFTPTGLKDIFIAVNAADLEDDAVPVPNSTAGALLKVAREILGADAPLECQQTPFPSVKVPGLSLQSMLVQQEMAHDEDALPEAEAVMSQKLVKQLADAGLSSLQAVLEHLGILTFSCLGKLNGEELQELSQRLRAVGFGPGHTCALRQLCSAASEEESDLEKDSATSVTKLLSTKLQSALRSSGLVQIQMVLAQCGVRSCNCLANLAPEELQEVRAALNAAGFKESRIQAFTDLQNDIARACQHKSTGTPEVVENELAISASSHSAEERPGKFRRLATPPRSWCDGNDEKTEQLLALLRNFRGRELSDTLEEELRIALTTGAREPETPTRPERRPVTSVKGDGEQRLTRHRIEKTLSHSKAIQADIVKYRDKVSGKLVEARVPTAVLALLKLRASCSGKPVSDQKLARMAVDVPLGLYNPMSCQKHPWLLQRQAWWMQENHGTRMPGNGQGQMIVHSDVKSQHGIHGF